MAKTSIFLSTASRELSAIYSSYGAKLPFGWWRISHADRYHQHVFDRNLVRRGDIGGLRHPVDTGDPVWNPDDISGILLIVQDDFKRGAFLLRAGAAALPEAADREGDRQIDL